MGMDVYGLAPTSEIGKYFRNSVWSWRPLADYLCAIAPAITSHCRYWQSNDGDGLTAQQAHQLADIVSAEIALGRAEIYVERYETARACEPQIPCEWCEATGIRRDDVGLKHGMPSRAIPASDPSHPRAGQMGWCNGCDGTGYRESPDAAYPLSLSNIQEFAAFLRDCGGFEIH